MPDSGAAAPQDSTGAGGRRAKDALFDGLAGVAKALASGRRAELVDLLAQAERSVEELAAEIGQSLANTSHHLQVLLHAGLVQTRRDGNRIYYSLASDQVGQLWRLIGSVARRHDERLGELVTAYLGDRSGMTVISRAELEERMTDGDVMVLDVRPAAEYAAGHIPGAVNIPPAELAARLAGLSRTGQAVAYCRGPFCVYADQAVDQAAADGRAAARLADGFPEWAAAGLPVETGAR